MQAICAKATSPARADPSVVELGSASRRPSVMADAPTRPQGRRADLDEIFADIAVTTAQRHWTLRRSRGRDFRPSGRQRGKKNTRHLMICESPVQLLAHRVAARLSAFRLLLPNAVGAASRLTLAV
jgi:hypothetical protein